MTRVRANMLDVILAENPAARFIVARDAVFRDDGQSLVALNARYSPGQDYVVAPRDRVHESLRLVTNGLQLRGAELDDGQRELVNRLIIASVITTDQHESEGEVRDGASEADCSPRTILIEAEWSGLAAVHEPLERLWRWAADRGTAPRDVVLRVLEDGGEPRLERTPEVVARRARVWRERCGEPALAATVRWELFARALEPNPAMTEFLDEFGMGRCVLLDDPALSTEERRQALALARATTEQGFDAHIHLAWDGKDVLTERIDSWVDAGCEQFTVTPLVLDSRYGRAVQPIQGKQAFDAALSTLRSFMERRPSLVSRAEPWRGILLAALVGRDARPAHRIPAVAAYVDKAGRWARSPEHAHRGIFEAACELLAPGSPGVPASLPNGDDAILPQCSTCGFAPLCDRYHSAEQELLQRQGARDRAAAVARFRCALRLMTIELLFDRLRAQEIHQPRITRNSGTLELVAATEESRGAKED